MPVIKSVSDFVASNAYDDYKPTDSASVDDEKLYHDYLNDFLYSRIGSFSDEDFVTLLDMTQEMIDYIEAPGRLDSIDFDSVEVHYYAPYDDNNKVQNLLSLRTASAGKHVGTGGLKASKEIATGSNANTTQVFTFKVTLTGVDNATGGAGKPYLSMVSVAYGDKEPQMVAPENGVITLTIKGAGFAIISNVLEGVRYTIEELTAEGWELVESTGTSGKIVADETKTATFTNAEKAEEDKGEAEEKPETEVVKKKEKKEQKKESKAKSNVRAISKASTLAQTGDENVVWSLGILSAISLAVMIAACNARRSSKACGKQR